MNLRRYAMESMASLERFFQASMARKTVLRWGEACTVRWRVWKAIANGSRLRPWELDTIFEERQAYWHLIVSHGS